MVSLIFEVQRADFFIYLTNIALMVIIIVVYSWHCQNALERNICNGYDGFIFNTGTEVCFQECVHVFAIRVSRVTRVLKSLHIIFCQLVRFDQSKKCKF
jgi:hypothetical protein